MEIQSTLIGLSVLASVILLVTLGIVAINTWEVKHLKGNVKQAEKRA